jgi:Holliday junction resolvase RusA-like endonuclease
MDLTEPVRLVALLYEVEVVPKGRPRMGKGFVYTPKRTKDFETLIKMETLAQYREDIIEGPVEVVLKFVFKKPKSNKMPLMTKRPDIDNCVKSFLDCLNDLVLKDDAQVFRLEVTKEWGESPRIEALIYEYGEVER